MLVGAFLLQIIKVSGQIYCQATVTKVVDLNSIANMGFHLFGNSSGEIRWFVRPSVR